MLDLWGIRHLLHSKDCHRLPGAAAEDCGGGGSEDGDGDEYGADDDGGGGGEGDADANDDGGDVVGADVGDADAAHYPRHHHEQEEYCRW